MAESDNHLNRQIDRLVSSRDPDEVKAIYQDWAPTYDSDLATHGYVAPGLACEWFAQQLTDHSALIYDAGCGTGQVGGLLRDQGYSQLHGSDFSTDMLVRAGMTGAYSVLTHADFSGPVDVADSTYNAVISVGVYTARFDGYFIPEMLRIVQKGGLFLFTCRSVYYESEVESALAQLLSEGKICDLENRVMPYMQGQGVSAHYLSMRRC